MWKCPLIASKIGLCYIRDPVKGKYTLPNTVVNLPLGRALPVCELLKYCLIFIQTMRWNGQASEYNTSWRIKMRPNTQLRQLHVDLTLALVNTTITRSSQHLGWQ